MSNKQQKKMRQLVRRHRSQLVDETWDMFFETMANLKFKYRLKMAWKIIRGKNVRKEMKHGSAISRN